MSLGFFLVRKFLCVFPCLLPVPYIFVTIFLLPIGSNWTFTPPTLGMTPYGGPGKHWHFGCWCARTREPRLGYVVFRRFSSGFPEIVGHMACHCDRTVASSDCSCVDCSYYVLNISTFAILCQGLNACSASVLAAMPCSPATRAQRRKLSMPVVRCRLSWDSFGVEIHSQSNRREKIGAVIKKDQKLAHMHSQHFTF